MKTLTVLTKNCQNKHSSTSIRVAARSMAWICGGLLVGISGSNPAGDMVVSLVSVVCCQIEVSESG